MIVPTKNAILDKTIEILESGKWIKGAYQNDDGFCAVGALYQAAGILNSGLEWPEQYDTYPLRLCLDKIAIEKTGDSLIGYNDNPKTTLPDVLKILFAAKDEVNCG